jgi:hypothetical protein
VAIGALVVALTFAAAPAAAGPVCNELDLSSPCIRSNDIRPNIALGGATGDGRLRLRNQDGANVVDLRASDGNLTNLFSNDQNESNGLVKAWARISGLDGTIVACWRCNTDPAETRRLEEGTFEVDFTPLATDIRGRPWLAIVIQTQVASTVTLEVGPVDPSSVFVTTHDATGARDDRTFFLVIF